MNIVLIILGIIVLLALAAAAPFLFLFFVYPRVNYKKFPRVKDFDSFRECEVDSIPYLISNGLPYPTDFEGTDHPTQSLNGEAFLRFDPDGIGETEGWYTTTKPDASWSAVTIPSTYNNADGEHTSFEGATWFLIPFVADKKADGDRFHRLCCRGVLLRCTVWLNGKKLGDREGGYTPFYFDISEYIKPGEENVLVIRSDNRSTYTSIPPKIREDHNPGWHMYGGIYRDVYIEQIPKSYVFKAAANAIDPAWGADLEIAVLTHLMSGSAACTLRCVVTGPDGKKAAEGSAALEPGGDVRAHTFRFSIKNIRRWSPESPDLYTVDLTLESGSGVQTLTFKAGIRTIEVKGLDILLNGKKIYLKGICKHEDDPVFGASQTPEIIKRDLELIKKMNANHIRLAHYPHHTAELAAARDMGFLLSEEIPLYQAGIGFTAWFQEKQSIFRFPVTSFGMRQMNDKGLMMNSRRQLIEMIERDRNNPAVIMWSVGNECYTLMKNGGRMFGWLKDAAKKFDSTRPVTMAELCYGMPIFDTRRMAMKHMDVISANSYFGWYYGETCQMEAHLENIHSRFPDKPIILSEFGADAGPGRSDADGVWKAERVDYGKTYSEDYQERVISDYWNIVKDRDYVSGIAPWVFSDFYNTWFPNNPIPNFNLKGLTSKERKPKKAYYFLQKIYGQKK